MLSSRLNRTGMLWATLVGTPFLSMLLGISQCNDPLDTDDDGDEWTENQGDCDDTNAGINPGAIEVCNGIDEDCDGAVDDGTCVQAPWQEQGDHIILTKNDASIFQGQDCDGNFFGTDVATVNNTPFAVGPYLTSAGKMAGLLTGGVPVAVPNGNWQVHNTYLLIPGGRCGDQPLDVTYQYVDGTTAGTGDAVVPWDCNTVSAITGTYFEIYHQGNYGGACCDNWYWGRFFNPEPSKAVQSIYVGYQDGCGGVYNGQMWALSID